MKTKEILAKDLSVNDVIVTPSRHFIVTKIEGITDKAITFRTNSVWPDLYDGNFFNRKRLTTKLQIR